MSWFGHGMNYGHQPVNNPYNQAVVLHDFKLMKSLGITKLRIAFPQFDSGKIQDIKALVLLAKSHGFYIIWGVSAGAAPVTATRWNQFKAYVLTQAQWAEDNTINEFSVGNEEELHCDGTTLTIATVQNDLRALAAAFKATYHGIVSYQASNQYVNDWQSGGLGGLDKIGFNIYSTRTQFADKMQAIQAGFGDEAYIAEWGTSLGFSDGGSELNWAKELRIRQNIIQAAGIQDAYYFSWRDGGFGTPAGSWGLVFQSGACRQALSYLANRRLWYWPGQTELNRTLQSRHISPARPLAPVRPLLQ